MKVILTQQMPHLGPRGAIVNVPDGYARNYLLPRRFAQPATASELSRLERDRQKAADQEVADRASAERLAMRMRSARVTIAVRATPTGHLYGSVNEDQIIGALRHQGYTLGLARIELDRPLDALGNHAVTLRLRPEVKVTITVTLTSDGT